MLVATIAAKDYKSAHSLLDKAKVYPIDVIELRLDYLDRIDLQEIQNLAGSFLGPKIFTLRKQSHGGYFSGSEEKRLQLIEQLATLNPDYFDLEYDTSGDFIRKLHASYPKIKLIASYHNFTTTPDDLDKLLSDMRKPEFYSYKIASYASSIIDTLRMLAFVYKNNKSTIITGICMSKLGEATRILAPVVGSHLNFAAVEQDSQTASGQLTIKTLLDVYNYKKLDSKTAIYALLGDPVEHSIGHLFHNRIFKRRNKNAVYLKLQLKATELDDFFYFVKQLPFGGFSVTMSLKERVLPYLDSLDPDAAKIKSVNTITVREKRYFGSNTDGLGALNAIEMKTKVKNKNIIIIGAGGTARAIAYESLRRGGHVTIINRTESKAINLAEELGCDGYGFDYLDEINRKSKFDILINATSIGMKNEQMSIDLKKILLSTATVLDMVLKDTPLIQDAKKFGFNAITGKLAFIMQGIQQQFTWFPK